MILERRINKLYYLLMILAGIFILSGCGSINNNTAGLVDFNTLEKTGSMDVKYAKQFSVDYYGDYTVINTDLAGQEDDVSFSYIIVPEDKPGLYNLPENMTVLLEPLDKTYLLSTSVMDLLDKGNVISNVSFSGTKESDWYLDAAKAKIADGSMIYAGKYSAPDYELLLSKNCNFVIANTMIYHKPESKEKLEELGIPVFVEKSSYETHPLGRLEWIKVYGLLYGNYDAAEEYFETQEESVLSIINNSKSDSDKKPVVAFFAVTTNGSITVRKPGDYIATMIELSGGEYALNNYLVEEENALSTMNIQMEDFYAAARDADILIYNSTIEGEIKSLDDIASKNELIKDFKAYKNGNVFCTGKNFFQESTGIGEFMSDINKIIHGEYDCKYLMKVN